MAVFFTKGKVSKKENYNKRTEYMLKYNKYSERVRF